jgi:hypothetical protein
MQRRTKPAQFPEMLAAKIEIQQSHHLGQRSRISDLFARRFQQIIPRTSERILDSPCGRYQNVNLPRLDSLDVPNVQIDSFSQLFL